MYVRQCRPFSIFFSAFTQQIKRIFSIFIILVNYTEKEITTIFSIFNQLQIRHYYFSDIIAGGGLMGPNGTVAF